MTGQNMSESTMSRYTVPLVNIEQSSVVQIVLDVAGEIF